MQALLQPLWQAQVIALVDATTQALWQAQILALAEATMQALWQAQLLILVDATIQALWQAQLLELAIVFSTKKFKMFNKLKYNCVVGDVMRRDSFTLHFVHLLSSLFATLELEPNNTLPKLQHDQICSSSGIF